MYLKKYIFRGKMLERMSTENLQTKWCFFGQNVPKAEIVYFCQMIIVFIIVIAAVVNLSTQNGSIELWVSLLSGCTGYILPNPSINKI